jgi:predicted nucleotidyltransferase
MGKLELKNRVEIIKSKIIEYFNDKTPILIYLFGSYAKELATEESDIDIAILLEKKIDKFKLYEYKIDLVDLLGKEIDLIDLNDANIILKFQVVDSGLNIYNRKPIEHYLYKYRIIANYHQYRDDVKIVKESIKKRGYILK